MRVLSEPTEPSRDRHQISRRKRSTSLGDDHVDQQRCAGEPCQVLHGSPEISPLLWSLFALGGRSWSGNVLSSPVLVEDDARRRAFVHVIAPWCRDHPSRPRLSRRARRHWNSRRLEEPEIEVELGLCLPRAGDGLDLIELTQGDVGNVRAHRQLVLRDATSIRAGDLPKDGGDRNGVGEDLLSGMERNVLQGDGHVSLRPNVERDRLVSWRPPRPRPDGIGRRGGSVGHGDRRDLDRRYYTLGQQVFASTPCSLCDMSDQRRLVGELDVRHHPIEGVDC